MRLIDLIGQFYERGKRRRISAAFVVFSRISRVRRIMKHASCLYESVIHNASDEQREREMRSISSLLIRLNVYKEVSYGY